MRYVSARVSHNSENDENIIMFLDLIFCYFNNSDKWESLWFVKFIFHIVIFNGSRDSCSEDFNQMSF